MHAPDAQNSHRNKIKAPFKPIKAPFRPLAWALSSNALWVKASSGVKKGPKNVKSRPLFLIHQTHQVIFAALFELVMVHILHRKKLDDVGAEYLTKIAGNVQKR